MGQGKEIMTGDSKETGRRDGKYIQGIETRDRVRSHRWGTRDTCLME
jgi:hypothetical protein